MGVFPGGCWSRCVLFCHGSFEVLVLGDHDVVGIASEGSRNYEGD